MGELPCECAISCFICTDLMSLPYIVSKAKFSRVYFFTDFGNLFHFISLVTLLSYTTIDCLCN